VVPRNNLLVCVQSGSFIHEMRESLSGMESGRKIIPYRYYY